ncbi:photosystem II reaction center W protein, chloroplastic-like [Magnolia sinica]|uniref:photosystem II reaction center W protein, chloroplastic-like n=1 Tax=Magnolia sinica TaxID=86752 RepID=UPI002659E7F5|nr:photosystem II reaction center W protein, chloroplastic-like [Magnolia sinica]
MATIIASTPTSSVAGAAALVRKVKTMASSSSTVLGLPVMARGRVRCSAEEKPSTCQMGMDMGMSASLIPAACAATMSGPALALVDERMTTEGTGLSLGVSNNLLGWILLGVFGLIWTLYFVYTSTFEEDEDSGLSL